MKKNVLYLLLILTLLLTMLSGCTQSNTPNNAQTDNNQPETNLVTVRLLKKRFCLALPTGLAQL